MFGVDPQDIELVARRMIDEFGIVAALERAEERFRTCRDNPDAEVVETAIFWEVVAQAIRTMKV